MDKEQRIHEMTMDCLSKMRPKISSVKEYVELYQSFYKEIEELLYSVSNKQ